jgi:hypothetical protein
VLVLQGEALAALARARLPEQLAALAPQALLVQRAAQDRVRALVPPPEATRAARPRKADRAAARWR